MKTIIELRIVEALEIFDVYFDGIEDPDDYFIEFGRWVGEKHAELLKQGNSHD